LAKSAAVVTAVVGTLTLMLEGGHMVISNNASAATVMAAGSVADGVIDIDVPAAAAMSAKAPASIMLEKGKGNKNGTKDIGVQA
jgi:hypothetical protein